VFSHGHLGSLAAPDPARDTFTRLIGALFRVVSLFGVSGALVFARKVPCMQEICRDCLVLPRDWFLGLNRSGNRPKDAGAGSLVGEFFSRDIMEVRVRSCALAKADLRDARFAPQKVPAVGDAPCFLAVGIVAQVHRKVERRIRNDSQIEVELAGGHRLRIVYPRLPCALT
jgi:hypothetical protein